MHLPNEGVLDLFQYFNFCFIGIVGPLQRGIRVGRGAPGDHRGRSLDWSFRNLGSEKLCCMSFSMCPVGGARQPQSGAVPATAQREFQDGGRGCLRPEGGPRRILCWRGGGRRAGSSATLGRRHGQFYQPV